MKNSIWISGCWFAVAFAMAGCVAKPPRQADFVRVPHVQGPYQRPLISPGAQFGALPPKVQNAVRAEAGIAVLDRVVRDRTPVGTIYKIYFQNDATYPPLFVSADGDVLNPDYTIAVPAPEAARLAFLGGTAVEGGAIQLVDLPEEVLKMIQQQAPHADIASIEKQAWGDRTVFVVAFKGENASPKLYVRSDGIVLKEVTK